MRRPEGPFPGSPPRPNFPEEKRVYYVVFTRRAGWVTGIWATHMDAFKDMENKLPGHLRYHPQEDLEWWMPQSGYIR